MFNDRLREYRNKLNLNKREMAERLEVSESYYNLIENNKRNPSRAFVEKLIVVSGRPEEYWMYGINENQYPIVRKEFKNLKRAIEQLMELKMVDNIDDLFNGDYKKGTIEELLIMALKSDMEYIIKNNEK